MAETIDRDELHHAIEGGEVIVLEALPAEHFDKEHLPGARNLPLDNIDVVIARLVPDKATPAVTYCSNAACNNSTVAAERLRELGYQNVRKYAEGKQGWIEAGLPVESGAAS